MPKQKRKNKLSQEEQSKRFKEAAKELEADGGLSPTEAAKKFEKAVAQAAPRLDRSET